MDIFPGGPGKFDFGPRLRAFHIFRPDGGIVRIPDGAEAEAHALIGGQRTRQDPRGKNVGSGRLDGDILTDVIEGYVGEPLNVSRRERFPECFSFLSKVTTTPSMKEE